MAAAVGTNVYCGEYAGEVKELVITAPIASASDAITLAAATHGGVTSIVAIKGAVITGGADAAFCILQVSFAALVITVVSLGADGLASSDWTGTTVSISLLIKTTA